MIVRKVLKDSKRYACNRHLQVGFHRNARGRFVLRSQSLDQSDVATDASSSSGINSNPSLKTNIDEGLGHALSLFQSWTPPRYLWRAVATVVIAGQVVLRILQGRVHVRNTLQQLESAGPRSVGVCLLTASFVGMAFTIQFVREFARLGLTRAVGGVLALALSRELSPVVTAIIVAGRVGSAFAAELGTMQVSEQTDTLRVLRTDPVDYLVTPRVIACCLALPILTLISFTVGMAASVLLAESVYNVSANIILDSAKKALQPWDFISTMIKSTVFGGIISVVSCGWGVTTLGGAKGVGESTTSAVVVSLVWVFIADFILSWCFFQGAGDALTRMG
ncbi:hypothetical protein KP509_39G011700 [Ceratopteris richardii]|nr:hypothetical protein KP509_39G011700 [Ceratopteris richardii]